MGYVILVALMIFLFVKCGERIQRIHEENEERRERREVERAMLTVSEAKKKRKRAMAAVLTLGLTETFSTLFSNAKDAHKGMSFENNSGMSFVFDIIIFFFWYALTAIPLTIINIYRIIDYSKFINNHS